MIAALLLLAATPAKTAEPAPAKCEAKAFTLGKPAQKSASGKVIKAEKPTPIEKPTCNHPGHAPGHKH